MFRVEKASHEHIREKKSVPGAAQASSPSFQPAEAHNSLVQSQIPRAVASRSAPFLNSLHSIFPKLLLYRPLGQDGESNLAFLDKKTESAGSPWVKMVCFLEKATHFLPSPWWQAIPTGSKMCFLFANFGAVVIDAAKRYPYEGCVTSTANFCRMRGTVEATASTS